MSTLAFTARATDGRATHYFTAEPTGDPVAPICGRLKTGVTSMDLVDDDPSCAACRSTFKRGDYALREDTPDAADVLPEEDEDDAPEEETLEGAEDDAEEDEKSTTKAQKFAAFARSYGWTAKVYVGTHPSVQGDVTFVTTTRADVRIRMAWQEGRYQYNASRIVKGNGALLDQFVRNASAARGYVNAINIAEDATKPVLLRRVK